MTRILTENFINNYGSYSDNFPLVSKSGGIENSQILTVYVGFALFAGSIASFYLSSKKDKGKSNSKRTKLQKEITEIIVNIIMFFGIILLLSSSFSFAYFMDIFFSKDKSLTFKVTTLSVVAGLILFIYFKHGFTRTSTKTEVKRREQDKISPLLVDEETTDGDKTYKQKIYIVLGYLLLLTSITSFGFFIYTYFFDYKSQYKQWYTSLPEEAIKDINYMKDITSLRSQLNKSNKVRLEKFKLNKEKFFQQEQPKVEVENLEEVENVEE